MTLSDLQRALVTADRGSLTISPERWGLQRFNSLPELQRFVDEVNGTGRASVPASRDIPVPCAPPSVKSVVSSFLLCSLCCLLLPASSPALVLAWDPEPLVTGYRLYWSTNQFTPAPLPLTYVTNLDCGNTNTARVTNLATNTCYHLAVTAYNFSGESDFSDELLWTNTPAINPITNAGSIAIRWTNRLASPLITWPYNSNACDGLEWSTDFKGTNWTDIPRTFFTFVGGEVRVSINTTNKPIRFFRRRLSLICTNQ